MAKRPLTPSVVPATLVVAASNSLRPERGDYRCTGVNDHLVIQAALDALPATGGEVKLLDGTYNCEVQINLDSNQTLRGCARNTILTTTTADLIFLSAVGGAGTEKTGILVADMQIDGGAGGVSDCAIYFEYVDYSFIQNVYSRRHASGTGSYLSDIWLQNSDFNTITGNTCQGTGCDSIDLDNSSNNIITGNICQGNVEDGIYLDNSSNNIITGNTCQGNGYNGIHIDFSRNNTITGNICTENSQDTTNTYDDIYLDASDYNNIQGNTCRAGTLANKPRYGINIKNAACDGNLVTNNDLYNDGFGTAPFNDAGTGTKLNIYVVPFVNGLAVQDSGFLIVNAGDYARAWLRLPNKVVQVVRMKTYARNVPGEADRMRAEFVVRGGADNEAYDTHNGSIADHPSSSSNFLANEIIYWTLTTAGVLALVGGDSIEVKVLHEIAGGDDCATDAYFRTVEIEYV